MGTHSAPPAQHLQLVPFPPEADSGDVAWERGSDVRCRVLAVTKHKGLGVTHLGGLKWPSHFCHLPPEAWSFQGLIKATSSKTTAETQESHVPRNLSSNPAIAPATAVSW